MEKDIDRIPKNPETDIIIRIDDFGGKTGLTIREFVKSERYTGFTKAGTRIPAEQFRNFKAAINSIDESDLVSGSSNGNGMNDQHAKSHQTHDSPKKEGKKKPSKLKDAPEEMEM